MGKIIYTCKVKSDDFPNILKLGSLPLRFQNAIRHKRPNPEKLKKFFDKKKKEMSSAKSKVFLYDPCWEIKVEGELDDNTPNIVEIKDSLCKQANSSLRVVNVYCLFDKWSEIEYFLDREVKNLLDYDIKGNTAYKINKKVIEQLPHEVKEHFKICKKIDDIREIHPSARINVKIEYTLQY